jgi:hypothetical protein
VRIIIISIIASMASSLSAIQAEAAGEQTRRAIDSTIGSLRDLVKSHHTGAQQDFAAQSEDPSKEDPTKNVSRVTHFRLCPKRLSLYVDEGFTLSPMPLGARKETIHGVAMAWEVSDPNVASVSSWGR